jgi:hypothetical protein
MWEPVGPLPVSVYRRRRWAAAGSVAAVVVLVTLGVFAVVRPNSGAESASPLASRAAATAAQSTDLPPASTDAATPSPTATPAPAAVPAGPPSIGPGPPAPTSANAEQLRPDDSPRSALPAPPPIPVPVPVPPSGPVPCADDMIGVTTEIDPAEHRMGQRPTMRLVVTNVSAQPCVRDLDSAGQEIVVWSLSGDRLWSSNDCVNGSSLDLRTLVPGQPVAFAVSWAGRTSVPGCSGRREVVPAGDYRVMSRVDGVVSRATDFRRLP